MLSQLRESRRDAASYHLLGLYPGVGDVWLCRNFAFSEAARTRRGQQMLDLQKSSKVARLCILAGTIMSMGMGIAPAQNMAAARMGAPATRTVANGIRESYADVVDHVAPAVVTITSEKRARAAQQFPFMDDPSLRQFF